MVNQEFNVSNSDRLFIKRFLHFKFILLKWHCPNINIDDYYRYLTKIVLINYDKIDLTQLIKKITRININTLVEYLNSEAVTSNQNLKSITLEFLK